jgi:hypothetical protein
MLVDRQHLETHLNRSLLVIIPVVCAGLLAFWFVARGFRHAPPHFDPQDWSDYADELYHSDNREAVAILREIKDGPAALAKERALAAKMGIPATYRELVPPLPPESENAAPLYVRYAEYDKKRPVASLPAFYKTATAECRWDTVSWRYAYTPSQIALLRKIVADQGPKFSLAHAGARKPKCVFTLDPEKSIGEQLMGMQVSSSARSMPHYFNTEAYLLARDGHYDEAIATIGDGFAIARQLGSIPDWVCYGAATAIQATTLDNLGNILHMAGPNATVANKIVHLIETDCPDLPMSLSASSYAADIRYQIDQARREGPDYLPQLMALERVGLPKSHTQYSKDEMTLYNGMLDAMEAAYLRIRRELYPRAAAPFPVRNRIYGQLLLSTGVSPTDPVRVFNKNNGEQNFDFGRLKVWTNKAVVYAGARVLAVKAATGHYPDQLPKECVDPFTRTALAYSHQGDTGFSVSTIKPDARRLLDADAPIKSKSTEMYESVSLKLYSSLQATFEYPGPQRVPDYGYR